MNVPPVISAKPTGAATALAASTEADGEEFASMIPTVQDDGQPVETTAAIGSEIPPDFAVATVAEHTEAADRPIAPLPSNVIQSLIAQPKLQSREQTPAQSELKLVGDIEAVLAASTPSGATTVDGAAKPTVAGVQPISAEPPTELAQPITPAIAPQRIDAIGGPATPEEPTGDHRGPTSFSGVLTDFSNSAQDQVAKTVPKQQASSEPIIAAPAEHEPTGASSIPGSTVASDEGVPVKGQLAPLPIPPVAEQATASTNLGLGTPALKPRTAEASQGGTGKQNAATSPTPGTSVGNTPAPTQTPSGTANLTAPNIEIAGPEASSDGALQTAGTLSDSVVAKNAPLTSGAGANSATAQPSVTNDTAVAFGSDLRLGADSVRPAAIDQAFRGQPLQPASEQVAVQISRAVQQGADRITVNLKPASLGHISVDLEIGPDNRLIAVIAADRPETLDLMQRDARALERALNDAGLKTDSGSLSFNLRGDGGGDHAGDDNASDWSSFAAPDNANDTTQMPIYARTLSADGGIDIRV